MDAGNMERGRERYTINCAMCHGGTGSGDGITSKYGLVGAASYHTDRLRKMSDGELFNVITNGKGQMMGYGYNILIDDRWRIVMYIRALQHAENAAPTDASADEQQQLQKAKKPAGSTMNGAVRSRELSGRQIAFERPDLGHGRYTPLEQRLDFEGGADQP
jgi:cytochrome c